MYCYGYRACGTVSSSVDSVSGGEGQTLPESLITHYFHQLIIIITNLNRLLSHPLQIVQQTAASWEPSSPSSNQYHIQTDEGPERYFRYQTDNGQFRKEKRLADGTVTGTEAWIDSLGYIRMKDYIADHGGYRILRSKTVFVGTNTPIQVSETF